MKCPICHFDNRDGVRFCEECGREIDLFCPQCGSLILGGRRFCGRCGKYISPYHDKTHFDEAERKMVTILFSDMVGYTGLFEKLDPEEIREILNIFFTKITSIVEKYGGAVEKIIGDAIMAIFGLPEAHEDDALRAIQSALEIHRVVEKFGKNWADRLGRVITMHSGINTGLVITGKSLISEGIFGVTGDTVNVASRLCDIAGPGEILVGYLTYIHAERLYEFKARQRVQIKAGTTMRVYKVVGPKKIQPSIRTIKYLRAEFIGRKEELEIIKNRISSIKKNEGGISLIEGDVGLGKSRIVEEIRDWVISEGISWYEGRGYPIFNNVAYFIFRDFLARMWEIEWKDSAEAIRKKVREGLARIFKGNIPEGEELISRIYGLRSEKFFPPDLFKSMVFNIFHEIFLNLSKDNPIVVCFEDLHWADPTSIELLRYILSSFRFTYPAHFIFTGRPGFYLFTRNEIQKKGSHYREIHLKEFTPEESMRFILSLLKSRSISSKLLKFVQSRAEGNPFFIEEIVNSLIETGVLIHKKKGWYITPDLREIECPSTIQEIITSRIDRLGRERKRVVQQGAVIGKRFLYHVLRMITNLGDELDLYLDDLENLRFLDSHQAEYGREYIFKNTLTHEVAYKSLLKKERRNYHNRVASALESFSVDEERYCELIAYHWTRGTNPEKAIKYNLIAALKNERINALVEAKDYYLNAEAILNSQKEIAGKEDYLVNIGEGLWRCCRVTDAKVSLRALTSLVNLYEGMGNREASLFAQIRMLPHYSFLGQKRACIKLYEKIGKELKAGSYLWSVAGTFFIPFYIYEGDYKNAIELIEKTRPFLLDAHPAILGMNKGCELSVMALMGNVKRAYILGDELLDFFERNYLLDMKASGHTQLLLAQIYRGDYLLARENVAKCKLLQERMGGASPLIARFLRTMGYILYEDTGDIEGLEDIVISQREEAGLFVHERSNPIMEYFNSFFDGLLFRARGETERAISSLRKALYISNKGFPQRYPHSMVALAETLLETGRGEEAIGIADRCKEVCLKSGDMPNLISSYRIRSTGLIMKGFLDEVEGELKVAEDISREMELRPSLAKTFQAWGLLWEMKGIRGKALDYYRKARDLWAEMGNPFWKDKMEWKISSLN
jgi:class 3 adenylate cyclase/tetratricopeptide (TPR) repeat protein